EEEGRRLQDQQFRQREPLEVAPVPAVPGGPRRVLDRKQNLQEVLSNLSVDRDLSTAISAPELLGLSLLKYLRVTPAQAQELLAEDGRRLARALADSTGSRNSEHLSRWLSSLCHYGGAIAELLLLWPEHAAFTITVLGHGLLAPEAGSAEAALQTLAAVCNALGGSKLQKSVFAAWLTESPALGAICALLAQRPSAQAPTTVLLASCSHLLMPLMSQNLKQAARSEDEYLAFAHLLIRAMMTHPELADACMQQGVVSHFMTRCVQRLADERSSAGTLQAAALLATDLWLHPNSGLRAPDVGEPFGSLTMAGGLPPDGLGDLLAGLKKTSQTRLGLTTQLVAFSCFARMLSNLCDRRDPNSAPAVYRTLIYALVESENQSAKDFATRSLMSVLDRYEGIPVGILAELMVKKFKVAPEQALAVMDIELFLVIAKHPRCTARHAEMLAQVLARCSVESSEVGRAASLPFLAILHRFSAEDCMQSLFALFVRVALTRLIQRVTPKYQVNQILEVLTKVACMRLPSLEQQLRGPLNDVCRAYLSNYQSLHPNLQGLLALWPADEQGLDRWVQAQFAGPQGDPEDFSADEDEAAEVGHAGGRDMELRSVTPSVHREPGTAREPGPPPPNSARQPEQKQPKQRQPVDAVAQPIEEQGPSAQDEEHFSEMEMEMEMAASSWGGTNMGSPGRAEQVELLAKELSKETEVLRNDLELAKQQQARASEEAEALRQQLQEAKQLQSKVQSEVQHLQLRREEILAKASESPAKRQPKAAPAAKGSPSAGAAAPPAAGPKRPGGGPGRPGAPSAVLPAAEDFEKAEEMLKIFEEPVRVLFGQYAKNLRGANGSKMVQLKIDVLERFLGDVDILPGRLHKRTVPQVLRAAKLHSPDDSLLFENFMAMLPRLAVKSFAESEAVAMQDFGIEVPLQGLPSAQLQLQAMLQHFEKLAETSHVSGLRVTRHAFAKARRQWVLSTTKATLQSLNEELRAGVAPEQLELPLGFDIVVRRPPPIYSVPEGLPIPASERLCAELLDEILHLAVQVHFLEPRYEEGARPEVVVKGYEDLTVLEPAEPPPRPAPAKKSPPGQDLLQLPPPRQEKPRLEDEEDLTLPPQRRPQRREPPMAEQAKAPKPKGRQRAPAVDQVHAKPTAAAAAAIGESAVLAAVGPDDLSSTALPSPAAVQAAAGVPAPAAAQARGKARGAAPRRPQRSASPKERASSQATAPPPKLPARLSSVSPERNSAAAAAAPPGAPLTFKERKTQQRKLEADNGKLRHEALQEALASASVLRLLKATDHNLRRCFEFFAHWKGGSDGSMHVPGFLLLGECFGILSKEVMKLVFSRAGGHFLTFEGFPEALMQCVLHVVEELLNRPQGAQDPELLAVVFGELVRHMLLTSSPALRKCLDDFRRQDTTLPQFTSQAAGQHAAAALAAAGEGPGATQVESGGSAEAVDRYWCRQTAAQQTQALP
ncbi:unnamed protein product, partial [Polarella glacialis]